MIRLIYSTTESGYIGRDGKLIHRIAEDMARFKLLTQDSIVIMGRKTYEEIPLNFRPLSNRINVVLSRNEEYHQPGCIVFSSLKQAIKNLTIKYPNKDIYIAGGEAIFKEGLEHASEIYSTVIDSNEKGDAKAPMINPTIFRQAYTSESKTFYDKDRNPIRFKFVNYRRT